MTCLQVFEAAAEGYRNKPKLPTRPRMEPFMLRIRGINILFINTLFRDRAAVAFA